MTVASPPHPGETGTSQGSAIAGPETFIRIRGLAIFDRMKVRDLRPETKVDVLELTIREKGTARDFSSRSGATGKVCDAKAVDEDGDEVSVSLWNEEIERVHANDRIRITNGWVRQWRGNMQVSAGRFGKLEVLSGDGPPGPQPADE